MKKLFALPIVVLMIASLVACNLPDAANATETPMSIDAAFTAAAETVEAQFTSNAQTQAAALPVATNTPVPAIATSTPTVAPITNTPLPKPVNTTQTCDVAQFVSDVTVPDGTSYNAGETFVKTWRIKNVGTCSWTTAYTLLFASGAQMNGPSTVALTGNVNPGDSVDLSVSLTAPGTNGDYTGYWKVRNAAGLDFTNIYVKIKVGGGGTGPTITPGGPTVTATSPAKFAVTGVTFTNAGGCSGFTTIANVQVNGAGSVAYHWVRSDGADDTDLHPVIEYTAAGTKTVTTSWDVSEAGDYWIEIYIDEPNHQQFGRAEFSCP